MKYLEEFEKTIGGCVIGIVGLYVVLTVSQKAANKVSSKIKQVKDKKFNKKVDELFEDEEQ